MPMSYTVDYTRIVAYFVHFLMHFLFLVLALDFFFSISFFTKTKRTGSEALKSCNIGSCFEIVKTSDAFYS